MFHSRQEHIVNKLVRIFTGEQFIRFYGEYIVYMPPFFYRLLQQLPKENYEIIMEFMCVLYHIQRFSDRNNMNSYNLSVCVSPSVMKPPKDSQKTQIVQTSDSSDVVTFLIDNYIDIFSCENEYILGPETDIHFDDGPGEDSDSGTDQYRERDLSLDDGEDSEKEMEPPTPEILFPPNIDSPFGHSDSSIGTNDSDELKQSFNRTNSPFIVVPAVNRSKSTPSSPLSIRRDDEMNSGVSYENLRNQSDMSDYDDHNEHFQRNLLRPQRPKRVLSNTSTTSELIEHKRHMPEAFDYTKKQVSNESNNKRTGGCYHVKTPEGDTSPTHHDSMATTPCSPSGVDGSGLFPKKQVMAQPLVQHFATEFYSTPEYFAPAKPNVVFHTVDKRKQPAVPSYEEHIQKTQSKPRSVPSERISQPLRLEQPVHMAQAVRKPKLSKKAQVQRQSVDNYQPPKPVQPQVGNTTKHDEKTSKTKPHSSSHLTHNFNNFILNRKNKSQHRNDNKGHPPNDTAHHRHQNTNRSVRSDSSSDQGEQEDRRGCQKQNQNSIAQLQNEQFENQVRNNKLATQMRNDVLTTHNRNSNSTDQPDCNQTSGLQNSTVDRRQNDNTSIHKPNECENAACKNEIPIVAKEADKKTRVPRISVTVMCKPKDAQPQPNEKLFDEVVPSNILKTDNVVAVVSSSSPSPVYSDVNLNTDLVTEVVPHSQNCKVSREGRKTFRSSTKFRLSPNVSPARIHTNPKTPTNPNATSDNANEVPQACCQSIEYKGKEHFITETKTEPPITLQLAPRPISPTTCRVSPPDSNANAIEISPQSPGPFSLNVTPTVNKCDPCNVTENPTKYQLEKASLTKATKNDLLPINQLTKMPNKTRDDNTKTVSAKELRRTSRKLKSEFRTFGDGKVVNTPREERRAFDLKKNRGIPSKATNKQLNGHYNTGKETLRRGVKINNDINKENVSSQINTYTLHLSSTESEENMNLNDKLGISNPNENRGYNEQMSVESGKSNSSDSSAYEAYSTMMSQEESYV